MSLFGSLGIGISGMNANRRGLETVSHNITNADNPAYVRQQTIQSDRRPIDLGNGQSGRGTDTAQIRQLRDEFLDVKLRREYTSAGYWQGREKVLDQIETIMNEKGVIDDEVEGGLGKIMDNYWEAWNELAKDPSNMTARGVLKERAGAFTTTVNHMYDQLNNLQENLNIEVKDLVDEVNTLTRDIADLNSQIVKDQRGNEVPNDLRDARNQKLDRLSKIVDISYYEDERNSVNVTLNGLHIVMEESNKQLEYRDEGEHERGLVDIYWAGEEEPIDIGTDIKGGELAAVMEARGYGDAPSGYKDYYIEAIPTMKAHLDELVRTIADETNAIHSNGFTIGGDPGGDFFRTESGSGDIGAGNIVLAFDSLDYIAAASVDNQVGNGKNAEDIANLRDGLLYSSTTDLEGNLNQTLTMESYYQDMILDLGAAGRESINMGDFHKEVIEQTEMKKESMSGVSLDEEMSDMLKFQHAYSASTRFINAIDEMLDVIVNKLGA